jgi:phage terminase large subunit GpA-like protein
VIKGACKISAEFEAGDQRFWHVACPGCAEKFYFKFDRKHFVFNETFPYAAHYVAPCCGTIVDYAQRTRWCASPRRRAAAGSRRRRGRARARSYHIRRAVLAVRAVGHDRAAVRRGGDNPAKLKTFWNLTLGLPFEVKGDAPDYERLLERARGLRARRIPARGCCSSPAPTCSTPASGTRASPTPRTAKAGRFLTRFLEGETTDPQGRRLRQAR